MKWYNFEVKYICKKTVFKIQFIVNTNFRVVVLLGRMERERWIILGEGACGETFGNGYNLFNGYTLICSLCLIILWTLWIHLHNSFYVENITKNTHLFTCICKQIKKKEKGHIELCFREEQHWSRGLSMGFYTMLFSCEHLCNVLCLYRL